MSDRVFRRILHPSDFSPASTAALKVAVATAKTHHARLLVAHVLPPVPIVPDVYLATRVPEGLLRDRRARGQRELDRLVRTARRAGVRAAGLLLDFGVVPERIVRLARRRRADLIVIGTHGRSGFAKLTLGSVAARVVTLASCPVLTVRARR
jgi:nucleotide-binding universal stress UspA family protein